MTSWMLSTLKSNLPRFVQSPNVIVSMPLSFQDEEREEFVMIADSVYYFAINAFGSSPNSARKVVLVITKNDSIFFTLFYTRTKIIDVWFRSIPSLTKPNRRTNTQKKCTSNQIEF